ncbi:MAG TPA: 16S rRNA (cytidine(1402)-2'-O)-methyltransferase [Gemmatimonadaceae bacterium]|nr:16S rRNA (cytidine(1402)-2'-O)-methyltransferase [Gemmatimonadaceae bacterium]
MTDAPGMLYIVSTPIGNLGDISARAIETLKQANVVLAEDTRHSRPLLQRFEIGTPLLSYHEHNEARTANALVARMLAGESMALISDAGTPLLSDPGARLVAAAIEAGVRVVPIPGASALLSALVASGISSSRFTFFGFLERKGAERASALLEIASLAHTAVLYEAAPRVAHTLGELSEAGCGNRLGSVARELTKQFEEVRRGTLRELAAYYEGSPPRGEVVIVIEGAQAVEPDEDAARDRARALRAAGVSARDVARALVADQGIARNVAYRLAQEED